MIFVSIYRRIIRNKWNTFIKLISLVIGICTSIVLMSQLLYDLSFDTFYSKSENIYRIQRIVSEVDKSTMNDVNVVYAPMPAALKDRIPEIEEATVVSPVFEAVSLDYENQSFLETVLIADSGFFDTFGLDLIIGDKKELSLSSYVYLSEDLSYKIFADDNPIGKRLLYKKKYPVVVAGVFRNIPYNTHLKYDFILSMKTLSDVWGYKLSWFENDSYYGYIKLGEKVDVKEVENKISKIIPSYYVERGMNLTMRNSTFYINPIENIHKDDPLVKRKIWIFLFLLILVTFISLSNFLLMSILELRKKYRILSLHKLFGASNPCIFNLLLLDNFIFVLSSFFISCLLLPLVGAKLSEFINIPIYISFNIKTLLYTLLLYLSVVLFFTVLLFLFFRNKNVNYFISSVSYIYWKKILLSIEFSTVICVISLLVIVLRQYKLILDNNLGYNMDSIVYVKVEKNEKKSLEYLKSIFLSEPSVELASISTDIPMCPMSGDFILSQKDKEKLFLTRIMAVDSSFFSTMDIDVLESINSKLLNKNSVFVNEEFINNICNLSVQSEDGFYNMDGYKQIAGVVKNFQLVDINNPLEPVMLYLMDPINGIWWSNNYYLILKLKEFNGSIVEKLSDKLKNYDYENNLKFEVYRDMYLNKYLDIYFFRNTMVIIVVLLLSLSLLGIISFIKEEVSKKSKEVTIRKIFGASFGDIFFFLVKEILFIFMFSSILGGGLSYVVSSVWLQQFAIKISFDVLLYLLIVFGLGLLVVTIVYLNIRKVLYGLSLEYIKIE